MGWTRSVGWVSLAAASLLVAANGFAVVSAGPDDRAASAHASAVRGESVQLSPPPHSPQLYPSGVCDHLAPGLPGLNGPMPNEMRQIGTSVRGRPIWAEYWGPPEPASVVVIVGQIHGNECAVTLMTEEVRSRPPRVTGVWLIPTLNPDGYAAYDRRNANQIDLNTDGGNLSQPETRALMAFIAEVRPKLTIHTHSPNGFVGAYSPFGPGRAPRLCRAIEARTGIRCSGGGAGTRPERSRWFLWQGHDRQGGETVLIELHAVSHREVPNARPRPATRSVEHVRADARAIVDLLDELG